MSAGEEVESGLPVESAAVGVAGVVEEGMIEMVSVAEEPSAMIASLNKVFIPPACKVIKPECYRIQPSCV